MKHIFIFVTFFVKCSKHNCYRHPCLENTLIRVNLRRDATHVSASDSPKRRRQCTPTPGRVAGVFKTPAPETKYSLIQAAENHEGK